MLVPLLREFPVTYLGKDVSDVVFEDNHLTNTDGVMAELYQQADAAGAPKYLVDSLLKTMRKAASDGRFSLSGEKPLTRRTFLQKLQGQMGIPKPETVSVELECGKKVTVSRNCFPKLLQDHLLSPVYETLSNLDMPDVQSPFSSQPQAPQTYSTIVGSYWYQKAYETHKGDLDSGKAILHPLLMYMDKTGVDQIMKNSVEPVVCTSAILNQSQRQDTRNWIVLGYIPNLQSIKNKSKHHDSSKWGSVTGSTVRDYHRCLASIMAYMKLIQQQQPVMLIRRGSCIKSMKIICPIVSVMGDNLSQNYLCGRIENKSHSSMRMTRCCLTTNYQSDRVPHVCNRFPTKLQKWLCSAALSCTYGHSDPMYQSNNYEQWLNFCLPRPFAQNQKASLTKFRSQLALEVLNKCLGSHRVLNAFDGMDFGPDSCINGSTSADIMHSFESGIMKDVLAILLKPLPGNDTKEIDAVVESIFGTKHSSAAKLFPRVSFLRGFCSLTLLRSSERVGQLFVIALLMNTNGGRALFGNRFQVDFDTRREERATAARGRAKRQRPNPAGDGVVGPDVEDDTSVDSSSTSTTLSDEVIAEEDDESDASDLSAGDGGESYSFTDRRILLEQLQLGFLSHCSDLLPADHHRKMINLIATRLKKRNVLDKILQCVQENSEYKLFMGVDLNYHSGGLGEDMSNRYPHRIQHLIDTYNSEPVQIQTERRDCSIALNMDQFKELLELMLCFHSFLKYGGGLFQHDQEQRIQQYKKSYQQMMLMITSGLKRENSSMQFKLQKFVECNHFLLEHLYRGPPVSFNTDTGERGLKTWAKRPAKTAQKREDEVFRHQVAQNYHESCLLGKAKETARGEQATDASPMPGVTAGDQSFVFVFLGDVRGFFRKSDAKKDHLTTADEVPYPIPIKKWFLSKLGRSYEMMRQQHSGAREYKLCIQVYTELLINLGEGEQPFMLRAHHNYKSSGEWFDYVNIRYEYDEGEDAGICPARCACFFQLPEEIAKADVSIAVEFDVSKEIMVLVQECNWQSQQQLGHRSSICSKWTMKSTQCPQTRKQVAKLTCITHSCLESPLFAFEDEWCSSGNLDAFTKDGGGNNASRSAKFDIVTVHDRRSVWAQRFVGASAS
jgi:hypothetical protein